jgi:hypothetical protein
MASLKMAGIAALFAAAACSNVGIRVPSSAGTAADGYRGPRAGTAVARSGTPRSIDEVRRVCRGSRPSGWLAIDYVSDTIACPSPTNREAFGTALIVRYEGVNVGEMLSVCADQTVPTNWIRDSYDPDDPRCPRRASNQGSTAPTVMLIRRVN